MKAIVALTLAAAGLAAAVPADAAQGCGRGFHRAPDGRCFPNGPPPPPGPAVVGPGPGPALVVHRYYGGRGYWDGHRYWQHRNRWHNRWRYY